MRDGFRQVWTSIFLARPVSSFRGIDVYRCRSDNQLVVDENLEIHAGHHVHSPVVLSLKEKLFLCLKSL